MVSPGGYFLLGSGVLIFALAFVMYMRVVHLSRRPDSADREGFDLSSSSFAVPSGNGGTAFLREELLQRFRAAIRIPTVSHSEYSKNDERAFLRFQDFLAESFPDFFAACRVQRFGVYGMALCWKGAAGSGRHKPAFPPVLYTAHYDVVPVEGQYWSHEPFAADVDGDMLYGRGTLDTKNSLMAMLEAAASLQAEGFVPQRDIWFAFGGDEETDSIYGAKTMAEWFASQGIHFEWVFDEGGIIARNMVPGIQGTAALVGVEEKGHADYRLTAADSAGHASAPGRTSALGRIAQALLRIESVRRPARIIPVFKAFLEATVPYQKGALKIIMANIWFFGPLLKLILRRGNQTRASIQTSFALTMAWGSPKANVLPAEAGANINARILPGENLEGVRRQLERIIADPGVKVELANPADANDPVPALPGGADDFLSLTSAALAHEPDFCAALPYLMTASTDSKYYAPVAERIFRFVPMTLDAEGLALVHGEDERINIEDYYAMIRYYRIHLVNAHRLHSPA